MSTSTVNADFTNVNNWQGVDDEPTAGSNNLVKSGGVAELGYNIENPEYLKVLTDNEDKVLEGIKADGTKEINLPTTFKDNVTIEGVITNENLTNVLNAKVDKEEGKGLSTSDYTTAEKNKLGALPTNEELSSTLNNKVDKVQNKSLIDAEYASSQSTTENPEYIQVTIDNEDKILEGITSEGVKQINLPIDTPSATIEHIKNPEWISVTTDSEGKILEGITTEGKKAVMVDIDVSEDVHSRNIDNIELRVSALENGSPDDGLGLHVLPENQGQLNMIKRCRQLTDIEWVPAVDLPKLEKVSGTIPDAASGDWYEGKFVAGIKYKGIPYGRCVGYKPEYGYDTTYVGLTISFETFVTAVSNPDSMVCKESVFNLLDNWSIPYAAVCSSLTTYALNVPYTGTSQIPNIPGLNFVSEIITSGIRMDLNTLKLGDVLNKLNIHTAVVTDIVKNNGIVSYVEICEATPTGNGNRDIQDSIQGGVCRRKAFSIDEFFWYFNGYSVYRYAYIEDIPYTKSPYVNIGNELDEEPFIHYPVMPYEGNGFIYKSTNVQSIKLLISCDKYSYLRVFKGDIEIQNSPFLINSSDTEKLITEVSVGKYSAYLCDMNGASNTTMTGRCSWEIK